MAQTRQKHVVTGKTTIVPLIGHPVEQVKSPGPMNHWFAENDVDAVIVPMDIRPERIVNFFDVLRATENCAGCSVTMPHKQAAFVASDEVTERARRAKAVNTIRRSSSGKLIGDMTDGMAFVAAMAIHGVTARGCNVLLIGAGGAGTAIAFELAAEGAASLIILERDQMRQRALMAELARLYPEMATFVQVPAGMTIDIAVNASPLGMAAADSLPFPVDRLKDARIVADAVTKPVMTPWLIEAEKNGLKVQNGEEMAVAQLPIQLTYLRFMPPAVKSGNGRKGSSETQESVG
ncbi:shikimate dehydrogenase [Neorhizobium sp. T25_13]|uniref:shikimate dehydrogenase family protein n=1 Tax=Neorhizobium sp. T25_13 TaxID=2093830 RepID=UPI000CF9C653|nr:shikimate dehydrogenase [Neorhizobium sp. T25_13]